MTNWQIWSSGWRQSRWSPESPVEPGQLTGGGYACDQPPHFITNGNPFEIRRCPHDVTLIQESDQREVVAAYLVEGSREVAVIDTGLGSGDLCDLVARLSSRRPVVLQTHLHWDHIGASHHFQDVRVHAAELAARRSGWPWEPEIDSRADNATEPGGRQTEPDPRAPGSALTWSATLSHGDTIALGSRTLEVLHTPGHSPGGLSFLDRDAGAVFSVDLVYFG
jgi:glyoxylase-like metal-dependent hydrolase (beta-lactamase superfamily II)